MQIYWQKATVAIVNFLAGFNVNPSSYLNPESGQKHYHSVTLLPEVDFFFFVVNILLLHLTGFHIFCSPPLVR